MLEIFVSHQFLATPQILPNIRTNAFKILPVNLAIKNYLLGISLKKSKSLRFKINFITCTSFVLSCERTNWLLTIAFELLPSELRKIRANKQTSQLELVFVVDISFDWPISWFHWDIISATEINVQKKQKGNSGNDFWCYWITYTSLVNSGKFQDLFFLSNA